MSLKSGGTDGKRVGSFSTGADGERGNGSVQTAQTAVASFCTIEDPTVQPQKTPPWNGGLSWALGRFVSHLSARHSADNRQLAYWVRSARWRLRTATPRNAMQPGATFWVRSTRALPRNVAQPGATPCDVAQPGATDLASFRTVAFRSALCVLHFEFLAFGFVPHPARAALLTRWRETSRRRDR